jgi:hypothetical protein
MIELVDWVRAMLILSTLFVFVFMCWRLYRTHKETGVDQTLLLASWLCFVFASGLRSAEAMLDDDGFKWTLVPFAIGVVLAFMYLLRPSSRIYDDAKQARERRDLRDEVTSLQAKNAYLSDSAYELARRNNELELERYYGNEGSESR